MRLLRLAALAGLIAALAAAAGCGGGTPASSGDAVSLEQLASAASTSADAETGRFAFTLDTTDPMNSEPIAFSGAFDATARRASLSFDFSSFVGMFGALLDDGLGQLRLEDTDAWRLDVVQDGLVMYMRLPGIAGELPDGKSWVRMDLREAADAQGFDFGELDQLTQSDPRELLDFLRATDGEIETVGTETLRGVETTHYRATVDVRDYEKLVPEADREKAHSMFSELVEESGLGEVPVDVWLDDAGLVRKLAMTFSATEPGGTGVAVTFELWDYGEPVGIELPPAGEVVDQSALRD